MCRVPAAWAGNPSRPGARGDRWWTRRDGPADVAPGGSRTARHAGADCGTLPFDGRSRTRRTACRELAAMDRRARNRGAPRASVGHAGGRNTHLCRGPRVLADSRHVGQRHEREHRRRIDVRAHVRIARRPAHRRGVSGTAIAGSTGAAAPASAGDCSARSGSLPRARSRRDARLGSMAAVRARNPAGARLPRDVTSRAGSPLPAESCRRGCQSGDRQSSRGRAHWRPAFARHVTAHPSGIGLRAQLGTLVPQRSHPARAARHGAVLLDPDRVEAHRSRPPRRLRALRCSDRSARAGAAPAAAVALRATAARGVRGHPFGCHRGG